MEELVYVQTVYYHCDNSPRNSLDVILVFIQEHPFPCNVNDKHQKQVLEVD